MGEGNMFFIYREKCVETKNEGPQNKELSDIELDHVSGGSKYDLKGKGYNSGVNSDHGGKATRNIRIMMSRKAFQ